MNFQAFNKICELTKNDKSKVKFIFDGEVLTGNETCTTLDMEEDDLVDYKY